MATTKASKLNALYTRHPPGRPLTSKDLAELGISADLAVHYERAGWLTRLARGVYSRPGESLDRNACLLLLQQKIPGLHVGGLSALDWFGIRQYVAQQPQLQLYGLAPARLPDWFGSRFPAEYHQKRLFNESLGAMLQIAPLEQQMRAPMVSAPERAVLEMLGEVGGRQSLQEARELVESTYSLRGAVMQTLLQQCTSVRTVRLCLTLGRELNLPWLAKLDVASLPIGSTQPWVARMRDELLVIKV